MPTTSPPVSFSIYSLLIFVSVVSLFFTYIVEFDHLVEEKRTGETGNLMIYLHYFILFGISLFTVALKFISEESAQPFFTASCLYGGIFLFYIGLWLANRYNRIIINGRVVGFFIATTIAGFLAASLWPSFATLTISIAVVTLANAACLTHYMLRHNN